MCEKHNLIVNTTGRVTITRCTNCNLQEREVRTEKGKLIRWTNYNLDITPKSVDNINTKSL